MGTRWSLDNYIQMLDISHNNILYPERFSLILNNDMTKPVLVPTVAVANTQPPLPDFIKVEKNLNTLGFFSPAKSRSPIIKTEKIVRFRREVNGRVVDAQATILPSAKYGLPTTADLDKYLAFQK